MEKTESWQDAPCKVINVDLITFPEPAEMSFFAKKEFDKVEHLEVLKNKTCHIHLKNHSGDNVVLKYMVGLRMFYCGTIESNIERI